MTAARFRKAFHFPEEDEVDPVNGVDEQEQEKIIEVISEEDRKATAAYKTVFLCLPAVSLLYTLLSTVVPSLKATQLDRDWPVLLLSVCSQLLSLLMVLDTPISTRLDRHYTCGTAGWPRRFLSAANVSGPLVERCVPLIETLRTNVIWLNGILVICLAWERPSISNFLYSPLALPLSVFAISAIACRELRPLNVAELEKLKYGYKGA